MTDWLAIERDYCAGEVSISAVAQNHGSSPTTVRRRAKRLGWTRKGKTSKREQVHAHFEGAVASNIEDMELGTRNASVALQLVHSALQKAQSEEGMAGALLFDARNLKVLMEVNTLAVSMIRRIQGLDDPRGVQMPTAEDDKRLLDLYAQSI